MIHLSLAMLLGLLVQLVIGGLIAYVLFWLIGFIGPPEPIKKVAQVILALVIALWLISLLMALGGHPLLVAWS